MDNSGLKVPSASSAAPAAGEGNGAGSGGLAVPNAARLKADEATAAALNSKLFGSRLMRRLIPLAYRAELYHVLRLSGPMVSKGHVRSLHVPYCIAGLPMRSLLLLILLLLSSLLSLLWLLVVVVDIVIVVDIVVVVVVVVVAVVAENLLDLVFF